MNLLYVLDQTLEQLDSLHEVILNTMNLTDEQITRIGFSSPFYYREYCLVEGYLNSLKDLISSNTSIYNSDYLSFITELCSTYPRYWLNDLPDEHLLLIDQSIELLTSYKKSLL